MTIFPIGASLVAGFFFLSFPLHADEGRYAFNRTRVNPLPDAPQEFTGRRGAVGIHFYHDRGLENPEVDSFPEPPVTIINHAEKKQCVITDGGIWTRSEIYLSEDGRILLLNEFSGAASDLVSYRTDTCQQIKRIDVSEKRWRIEGSVAHIGEDCTGANLESCALVRPMDLRVFFGR